MKGYKLLKLHQQVDGILDNYDAMLNFRPFFRGSNLVLNIRLSEEDKETFIGFCDKSKNINKCRRVEGG